MLYWPPCPFPALRFYLSVKSAHRISDSLFHQKKKKKLGRRATKSLVWSCTSHWGSPVRALGPKVVINSQQAKCPEARASGRRVRAHSLPFKPPPQLSIQAPSAVPILAFILMVRTGLYPVALKSPLNKHDSPKRGETPAPTDLCSISIRTPARWAGKESQGILPDSIQWTALPVTVVGWGGEGWDGNCFTRQGPLELDLKHQQAFPRCMGMEVWGAEEDILVVGRAQVETGRFRIIPGRELQIIWSG